METEKEKVEKAAKELKDLKSYKLNLDVTSMLYVEWFSEQLKSSLIKEGVTIIERMATLERDFPGAIVLDLDQQIERITKERYKILEGK